MQSLEVEDQVQLTYILKQAIQGLHKHLDEIEEGKRRLGGCGDEDEVEGCVVAVGYYRRGVRGRSGRGRVARRGWCEEGRQPGVLAIS